jgi:4'-phosphopantetheinyl transferase
VSGPGWLTRDLDDVPLDDSWLGDRERLVLAGLRLAKRRRDWRLGRWTAKTAVAALLDVPLGEIEVFAAFDGAPEVRIDGAPAPVSLSISHRAGRALAAVWSRGAIGCDLELIEPRSDAFVSEWLAPREQALVAAAAADDRARLVNLLWTAKEAASKVHREGLRLDFRDATADVGQGCGDAAKWQPLTVSWAHHSRCAQSTTAGWWRHEPGWVIAVAAEPAPGSPHRLSFEGG